MQGSPDVARKMFASQLFQMSYHGEGVLGFGDLRFTRVWVQGMVVEAGPDWLVLDDASGRLLPVELDGVPPFAAVGCEVAAIGSVRFVQESNTFVLGGGSQCGGGVRVLDKSPDADAQAKWMQGVMRVHQELYYPMELTE